MAHTNVAFDVERRRSSESECFHVGKHLGLEHLAFAPRSSETADQLVVHGATGNIKIQVRLIQRFFDDGYYGFIGRFTVVET